MKAVLPGGQVEGRRSSWWASLWPPAAWIWSSLSLIEIERREKDEVCPTWRPRRGDEILLMILTMASCFLGLILPVLYWGREEGEG
jgi:hypothetical protein